MVERLGGEWLDADTMEKLVLALEYPPLGLESLLDLGVYICVSYLRLVSTT